MQIRGEKILKIKVLNYINKNSFYLYFCIACGILFTLFVVVALVEKRLLKLKLIKSYLRCTGLHEKD